MRDLDLWRRLGIAAVSPADLLAIAGWSLVRRAPYVGGIVRLVDHDDVAIRAAALRALTGVRGVPGVRAIVAGLADSDESVREAALHALRETSRTAPTRYAHALFHPRVEVRLAALADVPRAAAELAVYLRADPACAELASDAPWPSSPLPLAFDLYEAGRLAALELVELVVRTPVPSLRTFFESERRRSAEIVDAHLEAMGKASVLVRAPHHDVIDLLVAAIAEAPLDENAVATATGAGGSRPVSRALEHLVETVGTRKSRLLTRRATVALLSRLATHGSPALLSACVALEPRVIEFASVQASGRWTIDGLAAAATDGLFRFRWPVRPLVPQIERLLELPLVRGDLALAVAIVGLVSGGRLKRLAKVIGENAILDALVFDAVYASDHAWARMCSLPAETPALELYWLGRVERANAVRYVQLAGIALGIFEGKRLEQFVEQIPRRHRHAAFLSLVMRTERAPIELASVCHAIAHRIDRSDAATILGTLLAVDSGDRGLALARELARVLSNKLLAAAARVLDDDAMLRFVAVIDGADSLPRDRELALAAALIDREHDALRGWAERMMRLSSSEIVPTPLPTVRAHRVIDEVERYRISTCSDAELEKALLPAFLAPVTGLVPALAARTAAPSVAACAALLGCGDPFDDVARQLDRFADPNPKFDEQLDNAVAALWRTSVALSPLAHARLFRWEAHTLALARWCDSAGGTLPALMNTLPGRIAAQTMWRGIAEVIVFLRYRDRPRLLLERTLELAQYCALRVDRPFGRYAARIVVALVESGIVPLSAVREVILDRTADSDSATREQLARLVRLDGMPEPPRLHEVAIPEAQLIAQIRQSRDLGELVQWCGDNRTVVVQEAVLALLLLGEPGQARLAALLTQIDELATPVPLLASVALWDSAPALHVVRELLAQGRLRPQWRFHLALGLRDHAGAIAAVRADDTESWFRRDDWDALVRTVDPLAVSLELVDSMHHHAYQRSIVLLLEQLDVLPQYGVALRKFLEVDGERPLHLRRDVARKLLVDYADAAGLPILLEELIDEGATDVAKLFPVMPRDVAMQVAEAIVDAALVGGDGACSERRMWLVLGWVRTLANPDPEVLAGLHVRILEEASTSAGRHTAAQFAVGEALAHSRLTRIAEVFAWGVRRGVELTGRLFRIHMTSKERDLGHTFLDSSRLFVSPLPLLRAESHGQDVVEGLILHELGHHIYHRGEVAQALWKQAHQEGIGHLLNLVADEHLERNLRGVDSEYGDRLKRLDAYAFQHAPQEIRLAVLLESLRGSVAAALCGASLEVAFDEDSVRMRRGAILTELERAGHPLARFARALRMGLGNRFDDPRVAAALAMCGKDLRKLDMQGLYNLTHELANLFGGAISVCSVFGGPEGLGFGERDDDVFGAGIDDEILQREVERILDPRRSKSGPKTPIDRLCINVNPDEEFDRIAHFERIRGDAAEHRKLANEVARHSRRLRAFLDDLGLRWERQHARIKGHTLDRTRLQALVTRNDPRILIARKPVRRTDLFLGTLIDCSGSMAAGQNIERAKRFAILVAEAVQPLQGVEARFFGFTDSVLYDCGDASDCGVSGLESSGGNNDAAALLHAAQVAANSRKRAKVIVMISDGLPTECSVASLRGLVTTLSRRKGIVCAQVAVRKLEEECFPHYVVLDDSEIDVAVARFGRMIGDLARRGLA